MYTGGAFYIIDFGKVIKIGCSENPIKRVKTISSHLFRYAGLKAKRHYISEFHLNYRQNENKLHKIFSKQRVGNSELFEVEFDKAIEMIDVLDFDRDLKKQEEKNKKMFEEFSNMYNQQLNLEQQKQFNNTIEDEEKLNNYILMLECHIEQLKAIRSYVHEDNMDFETVKSKVYEASKKYETSKDN